MSLYTWSPKSRGSHMPSSAMLRSKMVEKTIVRRTLLSFIWLNFFRNKPPKKYQYVLVSGLFYLLYFNVFDHAGVRINLEALYGIVLEIADDEDQLAGEFSSGDLEFLVELL